MATINVPYQNLSFAAPDENEVFRLSSNIDPTGSAIYSRKGDTIYNLNLDEIYNNIINPANRTATQGASPDQRKLEAINYLKQQGIDYNSIAQKNYIDLPQWYNVGGFKQGTTTDLNVFKPSPVVTGETRTLSINPTNPNAADLSVNGKIVSAPPPAPQPGAITPNFSNPQSLANPNANFFQPGQGGNPTPQQQNQVTATPTPQQPAQTYTIQSGDTLSKLAAQYGTTVGALMSLNPQITDANKIYSGQKINLTPSQVSNTQNIQAGLNAATLQAQEIQRQISSINSPSSSANPITPTTANGQTPTSNFMETYSKVAKELGLSDIKSAYTKALDESKALEDKKNEEAQNINNNPWYSQGKKQLELKKLDSKYESKLNTLSNYAKLYDSLYQEGIANAEFLTTGIQKEQQFALELAQKKQEAIDALKKDTKTQTVTANGREYLITVDNQGKVINQVDVGASKVAGGTESDLDKLLSVTEAEALGVPFGTTKRQAIGMNITGSPSVEQSKARQFGVAAEFANNSLNTLNYSPGLFELPTLQGFKSSERQQFENSARALVNSVLRRESGATITDDEYNNKYKELIPAAGDKSEVLAQKKTARANAVQSIKEAGGNITTTNTNISSSTYVTPDGKVYTLGADGTYYPQ